MIGMFVAVALLEPIAPEPTEPIRRETFVTRERIPIPYMIHASLNPYVECLISKQQSGGMVPQAQWRESSERSRMACAKKRELARRQGIREVAVKLMMRPDERADYVEQALVKIEAVILDPPTPPTTDPTGNR